jgi:hypothetical protein
MPDGTWLWGTYYRGEGLHRDTQYVLKSVDKGQTWTIYPDKHPNGWQHPEWHKFMEGRVLSMDGQQAILYLRAPGGHMYEKHSTDGGVTWSDYSETPTPVHPDAPSMVFKLADNRSLIAFIHNRYDPKNPNHYHLDRKELWFSISRDKGKTWQEPRFLLAQAKKIDAGPQSVQHDVSYIDLLVDGDELNLFVADGQVQTVLVRFHEKELDKFYTQTDLIDFTM